VRRFQEEFFSLFFQEENREKAQKYRKKRQIGAI